MTDANDKSIGAQMQNGRANALKNLTQTAGLIVYLGMICYSAVHNWRLLSAGIAPNMLIWAAVGVVGLELTALALPLALHFWTFAPMQRLAALAFYGLDLALIFANVVLDYALISNGAALPGWLQVYKFYALPASPVIAGLGWSLLFMLDPSQRERAMAETLRAATRESLAGRISEAAKSADISQAVDTAAGQLARDIVSQTLGISTPPPQRRPVAQPVIYHNAESEAVPAPLSGGGQAAGSNHRGA